MKKQYFGTDGIRGNVGQPPITPEFILKLGWAVGRVFAQEHGKSKILIGKDTRISGYLFESALEAGLSAAGVDIALLGPMPTPAVAYLTRTFHAQAGIIISASHNPYHDNGVKFFSAQGKKLPDETELAIEQQLEQPMNTVASQQLGKASRISDAEGRYIEFCKSTVPIATNLRGLRIVLDCANGATYQVAPSVFRELGAEVIALSVEPNGLNINKDCGSTAPQALQKKVIEEKADIGIAFDGDGDRVIMVDHRGEIVDGDEIVFIIACHRLEDDRFTGGVVGTLMTNLGLELSLAELNVPFVRTDVGDRHIMAELVKQHWYLGGEASGHIMCRDVTTTGDGIISALQVVADMVNKGRSLYELKSKMHKMPQTIINVPIKQAFDPYNELIIQQAVKATETKLGRTGRVLLRPSGTEPVIRVMVEGEEKGLIDTLAQALAAVVEDAAA